MFDAVDMFDAALVSDFPWLMQLGEGARFQKCCFQIQLDRK